MPEIKHFNGFKTDIDEITLLTFNNPKVNIFSTAVLRDFIMSLNSLYSS